MMEDEEDVKQQKSLVEEEVIEVKGYILVQKQILKIFVRLVVS